MNWIWSKVGKVLGGLFLLGGGTVSAGFLAGIVIGHASGGVLTLLTILMVMFGLAPAAIGGWLLHTSLQAGHQALRERFFQLLQSNQGRLSLLDFATAARLEPAIARQHLDSWAKEFSATFEVSEAGEVYYVFATEPLSLPESPTLQVLGQTIRRLLQSI